MGTSERLRRLWTRASDEGHIASAHDHEGLTPGSTEYDAHVAGELKRYTEIFQQPEAQKTLTQPVPGVWREVERRAQEHMRVATGDVPMGHLLGFLRARPRRRLLSLGCGAGGVEIEIAKTVSDASVHGVDLNDDLLQLGRARAAELGLNLTFDRGDLNLIELPAGEFDAVWCHASLHHVLELERLAGQIEKTLRPGGRIFVVDVISRNGYLFWPENGETARAIFRELPERLRVNHTAYAEARVDAEIWEADTSVEGMECIRSQDIVPVFRGQFETIDYVPYFAICRRFFDTMYGPNYDLSRTFDRLMVDAVWQHDVDSLRRESLRPETFFGVFEARSGFLAGGG